MQESMHYMAAIPICTLLLSVFLIMLMYSFFFSFFLQDFGGIFFCLALNELDNFLFLCLFGYTILWEWESAPKNLV